MKLSIIVRSLCILGACTLTFFPRADRVQAASSAYWEGTGSMSTQRFEFSQTVLPNGTVLVAGGWNQCGNGMCSPIQSAELYNPITGTWNLTGDMGMARGSHTATLLPNGKVLIAGGNTSSTGTVTNSAELYDPASGRWSATGSMAVARADQTATLLSNGKVLIAGGDDSHTDFASAELYDPASGTWSSAGTMPVSMRYQSAALMSNGKVLVVGGLDATGNHGLSVAAVYDPASNSWSGTADLPGPLGLSTATALPTGKVLLAGGAPTNVQPPDWSYPGSAMALLYDPATGTWSATGPMTDGRAGHVAVLLPTGKVLVAGGTDQNGSSTLSSAEYYDPASGTWTNAGTMPITPTLGNATLLPDGRVLIVGGIDYEANLEPIAAAALYSPTAFPKAPALFLKVSLAHSRVAPGQTQRVTVSTVPLHTEVRIQVTYPNAKHPFDDGVAGVDGSFSWSFTQPAHSTTKKNRIARVSVSVESGDQIPVSKSKRYTIH